MGSSDHGSHHPSTLDAVKKLTDRDPYPLQGTCTTGSRRGWTCLILDPESSHLIPNLPTLVVQPPSRVRIKPINATP